MTGAGTWTVELDAFGTGDSTAYDVGFTSFDPERRRATFEFVISDGPDLGPASQSPVNGWVTWLDGEIALAFSYQEGLAIGCARSKAEIEGDDEGIDFDALAKAIATSILTAS